VEAAADGPAALAKVMDARLRPDVILADFNLPGMTGLETARRIREALGVGAPVVILTGDISTETLRDIQTAGFAYLSKPVKPVDLSRMVADLLPHRDDVAHAVVSAGGDEPLVYIVDDDERVREAIALVFADAGMATQGYPDAESFLGAYDPDRRACLLIDAYLPGMDGLHLLRALAESGRPLPSIMITGRSDVAIAVEAMKSGACDFIEKPIGRPELLAAVTRALEQARGESDIAAWRTTARAQIHGLTERQRQVMAGILEGLPNKTIAFQLGISQRTVENHRAAIMKRTGVTSIPALARLAVAAG
jgi:two-component system CheB/CheR fusion protein